MGGIKKLKINDVEHVAGTLPSPYGEINGVEKLCLANSSAVA